MCIVALCGLEGIDQRGWRFQTPTVMRLRISPHELTPHSLRLSVRTEEGSYSRTNSCQQSVFSQGDCTGRISPESSNTFESSERAIALEERVVEGSRLSALQTTSGIIVRRVLHLLSLCQQRHVDSVLSAKSPLWSSLFTALRLLERCVHFAALLFFVPSALRAHCNFGRKGDVLVSSGSYKVIEDAKVHSSTSTLERVLYDSIWW